MSRRLLPTVRGAADFNASSDTPPDVCPPHAIRNVRMRTGTALRRRPGKRPGLAKVFGAAIGGGAKVQLLEVITKAAGTTFALGTTTQASDGLSEKAEGLLGQAWFLDSNRAMFRAFRDPYPALYGSTSPTPGNYGAFACGWHPDGSRAAVLTIVSKTYTFTDPITADIAKVISHVTMYNPDTDAAIWHTEIEDKEPGAGTVPANAANCRDVLANSVRVYGTFTYVCAGPYVYVLRTGSGIYIKRYSIGNEAWEVMDCRVRPDNTLVVLYLGTPVIAGPVVADDYVQGAYFRSGLALFDITTDTSVNGDPLVQRQFGAKKTNAYAYYEDQINFRFSEHSLASPRGCYPQGFGMGSDGAAVVGRSNQGFGPTVAFPPDSVASPPITVCKVSAGTGAATMLWEADTDSEERDWNGTGWYNDIGIDAAGAPLGSPPAGPEQSVLAIAVSQTTSDVYAAGKRANGFCVFGLRGDDGVIKWKRDLGGTIYQHCVAVDPVSGLVVVGGQRNSDWEGAGGALAHLWWLDPDTGEVRFHYDLDEVTSVFGLDVSSTGRLVYTTGFVS